MAEFRGLRWGRQLHMYMTLVGKVLDRPRIKWEDNIKMDLQEVQI
jgi:hypothetical protein